MLEKVEVNVRLSEIINGQDIMVMMKEIKEVSYCFEVHGDVVYSLYRVQHFFLNVYKDNHAT